MLSLSHTNGWHNNSVFLAHQPTPLDQPYTYWLCCSPQALRLPDHPHHVASASIPFMLESQTENFPWNLIVTNSLELYLGLDS